MNYSFLVWDNADKFLPFPADVLQVVKNLSWSEIIWYAVGLPVPLGTYSMLEGKALYLDKPKMERSEFTGEVLMASYFVDKESQNENFFVSFLVTFVKGDVLEIKLNKVQRQPFADFKKSLDQIDQITKRRVTVYKSWWFKWLYTPWFYIVRVPAFLIVLFISAIQWCLGWVVKFLTPFEF